jgi:hypothetical protein
MSASPALIFVVCVSKRMGYNPAGVPMVSGGVVEMWYLQQEFGSAARRFRIPMAAWVMTWERAE